jgi:hypothetical protein
MDNLNSPTSWSSDLRSVIMKEADIYSGGTMLMLRDGLCWKQMQFYGAGSTTKGTLRVTLHLQVEQRV